nr:5'-nucleotidase C-terminal domain-containing protein [Bacillus suaedaesalsae]
MVVGFFTPAIPSVKAAEVITVADAIANNTGTATVEGYIVATATSGPTYKFVGPFTVASNIAIADSPDETDKTKILPVQLVSGTSVRAGLNLIDNPENHKAKVQITGSLEAYFGVAGLKSPTAYTIIEGGTPTDPQPEPTLISISEARTKSTNTEVIIEGVVTADNSAIGGGKLSTYIQDTTAGINLYSSTSQDLKEGDQVKVKGKLAEYKGLKEIVPTSVEVLASNQPLPQAKSITLSDLQTSATAEPLEGQLVKVTGYVNNVPSSPAGGGYNVSVIDSEFNSTTLRVLEGTSAISAVEAGNWYEFTAIVSQYDSYQLLPRKAGDIQLLSEQPAAPNAEGEYPAVVKAVVDGDTVNLESPVLGSTKVRFVNIDTPETFNATNTDSSRTEINANQKEHGEAAKVFMNTLLKAGDQITLKIGQEPTDAYGRLLAQVVRQDNVNVNLEMVRQGYAATYFIYPVGNEDTYNEFQAAVKEAKDNKKGIWSETNPLLELPFVFRTNDSDGIFDKLVGNSDTKLYVSPEKWAEVPVEKRVFFWNETDATYAGYAPASPSEEPVGEDPNGSEDNISLQLLSLNDLHGKIDQVYQLDTNGDAVNETVGRMDFVAAYLKQREATNPNTLIVNAGDMIGGSSPVSALLQDEPTVEIMEAIGFDYGTVGNHEFDEGTTELLRIVNGGDHEKGTENYDGINFPVLCANCISKTTNEPILPAYDITEVDGVKVGFIGVNTTATATMVIPSGIQDITFTDEKTAVNKAVTELNAQGVKSIIVLAHMPASQSGTTATGDAANLANAVDDEVDVIFAAHNHEIVDAIVDNKLIVQALDYGKAFADIDLEIDPTTKDIVKKEAEIVYVDQNGITPDPVVEEILTKYLTQTAEIMNQVIGEAAVELKGGYGVKGPVGDNALGNLIADSMLWAMDTDFALMNGGGIRDNINAGEITWSELFNVQPFGNVLVSAEITGADLEQMLNAQISAQYGPDVSVGGFKYTWDGTTNKVVDIFLPNGSKINKAATYTVTVNNYMYEHGTDKYKVRGLGENPIYGLTDLEGLVSFVESFNMSPINYQAEGRISEIVPEQENNLGEVTIAEARAAELGSVATIEGVVTSTPGAWGSKAFYIQDDTSGSYVFTSKDYGFKLGDVVKLTGKTADYNGEFQLADLTEAVKISEGSALVPMEVTPADLSETTEGQLVILEGATISNLRDFAYGTFEFDATKNGETVLVRVDNRTGLNINNFTFNNGDVVNITGISGQFNEKIQLKPRMIEDIVISDATAPVTEITLREADLSNGAYLQNVEVSLAATDAETGVDRIEYSLDGGQTWVVYENPFVISQNGTSTIQYHAIDKAGNVEEVKSVEVVVVAATLTNAKQFVLDAEAKFGVKVSTYVHLLKIELDVAKGKDKQAYKKLNSLQKTLENQNAKTINQADKADLLKLLNYIETNKTL